MAAFNNDQRRNKYIQALDKSFSNSSINRCLYIGDGLLLPLLILEMYPNIEINYFTINKYSFSSCIRSNTFQFI